MTPNPRLGLLAAAFVLVLVVTGIAGASAAGAAQAAGLQISEATLQLWPEYDDPGLLVILSGTFTGTTTFPQNVTFNVPQSARNIQATYLDASGSPINRQFELKEGKLTYELPTPDFHLEYYVDRQPGGNERKIQYTLDAAYPIDTLSVVVQQPARSTDFSVEPAAQTSQEREDGLTYHFLTRNDIAAGENVNLTIAYAKTDTGLSSPQLTVTDARANVAPATQASATTTNWVPWALIIAGVLLLAGIGAYYFLSQRPAPATQAFGPRRPTVPASTTPGKPGVFCTQCGKPLRPDDRFCAQCGTPRRN